MGALELGRTVDLSIDVWDEPNATGQLRLWVDGEGETLVEMESEERLGHGQRFIRLTAHLTPKKAQIIWYYFLIRASDGSVWSYGARREKGTGEGAFSYTQPRSFQLTVYEKREQQPEWYQNGIAYQILPDRFDRGANWHDTVQNALMLKRQGAAVEIVQDWTVVPFYRRDEAGNIAAWDFYGGNLAGIRERLSYLKAFGVSIIYLSPIFESASNHRFDAADYMKIDPMIGDMDEFEQFCAEAKDMGMSIILSGNFTFTGADSVYFNRYGNYDSVGAFQSKESPYASWYDFDFDAKDDLDPDYLPRLNVDDPSFREYICGEDGVIRYWIRHGAAGWRIDLAEDLSDDFIAAVKAAALAERADAVVIGEVFGEATTQLVDGQIRKYLQGQEFDGVQNQPVRNTIIDYVCGRCTAWTLADLLEDMRENYPREALMSGMNLLSSEGTDRLFTVLGEAPDAYLLNEYDRRNYRLPDGQKDLGTSRMWLATLLQLTLPGVPCVYYGDEAGMQGFSDPYNRATFPWANIDRNCRNIYRNAVAVRRTLPEVFVKGDFEPFAVNDDVLGFWRTYGDVSMCVLFNSSLNNSHTVWLPMKGEVVDEVVEGEKPMMSEDGKMCAVNLWPLKTAILYFHVEQRMQKPLPEGMGVLCHITSVPNGGKPGTMGECAKRFIDYLEDCGQTFWQVLPVNPTDEFKSPYAGLSAFAGNPYLIDGLDSRLDVLIAETEDDPGYEAFKEKNADWLEPYVTFRAIKETVGEEIPWRMWPENFRTYREGMADSTALAPIADIHRRVQYIFEKQWQELRAYANERGIKIIGDMPMYVSADSSDVWSEREIFALAEDGTPLGVAGCPPDDFAKDGQIWGNPTFRWDVLKERDYDWWLKRLGRMLEFYDYVRLDHFLGFSSYYNIPGNKGALEGSWNFGPGLDLFRRVHREFGDLSFIAEDLGTITPAVHFFVAACGFPGMDVVQFYDHDVREGYVPLADKMCYSGTHDNQTLLGWIKSKWPQDDAIALYHDIIGKCLKTDADVVILPLQDVLCLDDSARMNVPGVAEGNWSWMADGDAVEAKRDYLKKLTTTYGRKRK